MPIASGGRTEAAGCLPLPSAPGRLQARICETTDLETGISVLKPVIVLAVLTQVSPLTIFYLNPEILAS